MGCGPSTFHLFFMEWSGISEESTNSQQWETLGLGCRMGYLCVVHPNCRGTSLNISCKGCSLLISNFHCFPTAQLPHLVTCRSACRSYCWNDSQAPEEGWVGWRVTIIPFLWKSIYNSSVIWCGWHAPSAQACRRNVHPEMVGWLLRQSLRGKGLRCLPSLGTSLQNLWYCVCGATSKHLWSTSDPCRNLWGCWYL